MQRSSQSEFGQLTGNYVNGHPYFLFFSFLFSVVYFSHKRSAQMKKIIQRKLMGAPKNLEVHLFPSPVSHFGAPGGHFGFLRFSYKEWLNKETYFAKVDGRVK